VATEAELLWRKYERAQSFFNRHYDSYCYLPMASASVYSRFNNMGLWGPLNRAYINSQIFLNQQVYLSSSPVGQTGWFAMELKHLASRGLGPEEWRFVPYSQLY
jgi:hypothetical protein